MKHAATRLATRLLRASDAIGFEGATIAVGTVLLAIGAGYLSPAGPWLVVGTVLFLIGLVLALPEPPQPPQPGAR
jgi:hypothetical protein